MSELNLPEQLSTHGNSKYSPELLETVLTSIALGQTVTKATEEVGISRRLLINWSMKDEAIREAYLAAKELGFAALGDECLDIADNLEEEPSSRKVRIWTRLQLLARWNPKDWAPRVDVNLEVNIASAVNAARERVIEHRSSD